MIASLQDLMRVGTNKTNKLYKPLYDELIKDYRGKVIAATNYSENWVNCREKKLNAAKINCSEKAYLQRKLAEIKKNVCN